MAEYYLWDGAGGLNDGSSWVNAWTSIVTAVATLAAGDTLWIASTHNETGINSSISLSGSNMATTVPAPKRYISVDKTGNPEPPTVWQAGAVIEGTGSSLSGFTINGHVYMSGLTLRLNASGAGNASIFIGAAGVTLLVADDCVFDCQNNGSGSRVSLGTNSNVNESVVHWNNCVIGSDNPNYALSINNARLYWNGGIFSIYPGGANASYVINGSSTGESMTVEIDGVDLSAIPAAADLVHQTGGVGSLTLRNCKLPASWTGSVRTSSSTWGGRARMHNCDGVNTNNRFQVADFFGDTYSETSVVRVGGATDGVNPFSYRVVSDSRVTYWNAGHLTPEMVLRVSEVGVAKTLTIEVVTDNVTLTDEDAWLDVMYLGDVVSPRGSFISTKKASAAAAQAYPPSSATWNNVPGTPVKQKMSVTFTPQKVGYVHVQVRLARPSTTIYIDPKPVIT